MAIRITQIASVASYLTKRLENNEIYGDLYVRALCHTLQAVITLDFTDRPATRCVGTRTVEKMPRRVDCFESATVSKRR